MADSIFPPSSQILGPAIYGLVYTKTVAVFPRTIFLVTVLTAIVSFSLLALVRIPENIGKSRGRLTPDMDVDDPEEDGETRVGSEVRI